MISRISDVLFGDVLFSEYGAFAYHANVTDTPARSRDVVNVPGRNGALIYDNGRYDEIQRVYDIAVDTLEHAMALIRKVKAVTGYARLSDDLEPDVYMMARVETITTPTVVMGGVRVSMTFTRKPQKFMMSGEAAYLYESDGYIYNPSDYTALPLVRVYGTGEVTLNNTVIRINSNGEYIDIDCDLQDAHNATENLNDRITLVTGGFWELQSGYSDIALGHNISRIKITPRWWTL